MVIRADIPRSFLHFQMWDLKIQKMGIMVQLVQAGIIKHPNHSKSAKPNMSENRNSKKEKEVNCFYATDLLV